MKQLIIAIDGFSSTGKSTLAKALAKTYDYIYVDTGAMYRAVTLYAINSGLISATVFNETELIKKLDTISVAFKFNSKIGYAEVYLNGENVESKIRSLEISKFVSQIATLSAVRKMLVKQQQHMGENGGLVMDGRDIGTVVFPNADVKFFMTAKPETRAKRRFDELIDRGHHVSYDEVLANVISRDTIDSTRKDSPLKQAEDAIKIDNSDFTIAYQLELMSKHIDLKLSK